jgi:hypothetical protein
MAVVATVRDSASAVETAVAGPVAIAASGD